MNYPHDDTMALVAAKIDILCGGENAVKIRHSAVKMSKAKMALIVEGLKGVRVAGVDQSRIVTVWLIGVIGLNGDDVIVRLIWSELTSDAYGACLFYIIIYILYYI